MTTETKPIRVLSLGAGVQSSTLALLAKHGEVEMPSAAIFSDTQWEPQAVYDWLDWLEKQLPFPVYRVTKGNLRDDTLKESNTTGQRFASVPWHFLNKDGTKGMGLRQCTHEYKITPLVKKLRDLCGLVPKQRAKGVLAELYVGISTDEVMRVKPSRTPWYVHRWPLIELRMDRQDCIKWMADHGYPRPPKSSCLGCPYHHDSEWRAIKADPEAWADLVKMDAAIRVPTNNERGLRFMHRSCVPLDQVDLSTAADHGQVDLFNNECEGMCGV